MLAFGRASGRSLLPARAPIPAARYRLARHQEPAGHEASISEVEAELQLRGGFIPLMHLFPSEEDVPGLSIPWTPADTQLREWLGTSPLYQAAIAGAK